LFYIVRLPNGEKIEGITSDQGKTDLIETGFDVVQVTIETIDFSKPMEKWN